MKISTQTLTFWLDELERKKVYPLTKDGIKRLNLDIKSDEVGKRIKWGVYGIIIFFLIEGILTPDYILTYFTSVLTSKTVRYIMNKRQFSG